MEKCGNCSSCGGCAGVLELTQGEVEMLDLFSQFAFLPVCRRPDDMVPVYPDGDGRSREEYSVILLLLEQKRLISIDYDKPIGAGTPQYPVVGSAALTQRGQLVVEQLQLVGIQ